MKSFGSRKPKGLNYLMFIFVEVSFKNGPSIDTGNIRHKTRNEDNTQKTTQQTKRMSGRAHKNRDV